MGDSDDVKLARMGLALALAIEACFTVGRNHEQVDDLLDEARDLALSIDNGRLRREQEGDTKQEETT